VEAFFFLVGVAAVAVGVVGFCFRTFSASLSWL